jgi:predicted kinase
VAELVIYRGLPASGKTTLARAWVAEDPAGRARVNRDDLRQMLREGSWIGPDVEKRVAASRDRLIELHLAAGISVASDDTNLPNGVCRQLAAIGARAGVAVRYVDLTDVPVEVCLERDKARFPVEGRYVGVEVITRMHERFVKGRPHPLPPSATASPAAVEAYVPDATLPSAWIVDVDGTLAIKSDRSPYDWDRVGEDAPNESVAELVRSLALAGYKIVVVSGRDSVCRPQTESWLYQHGIPYDELLMRARGDVRKDSIVKLEILRGQIASRYNVRGVIDDRRQVVEMWRSLGLVCAQVAPGDF